MHGISLKKNERIVWVVRRYILTYALSFFAAGVCFSVAFFSMFWLFRQGLWGHVVFFLLLALGSTVLLRMLLTHYRNVSYITTHRVVDIDRRGFFHTIVSDIPYDQIDDVSGHIRGVWGTLFRYGEVQIQTARGTVTIGIDAVHHPTRVQRLIHETRNAWKRREHQTLTIEDIEHEIHQATPDELDRLEAAVVARKKELHL